jgi:photosystem II stability/assembly factor-like uncharacterized protein
MNFILRIVGIMGILAALVVPASPTHSLHTDDPYVDWVVSFTPGNPASTCCNNSDAILGPPDFNADALSGFLSLGVGGSVTAEFVDNLALDGPGADIDIIGDPANDEQVRVEVSTDGTTYKSFGLVGERVQIDLAAVGLDSARFVRITDDGNEPLRGVSPGAEVDAIQALNSTSPATSPSASTALAAATATHPAPVSLTWVRTGGPLGGLGYDIRMRPDNPDVMFVTDAFAGVHKSTDGGQTWVPANQGITGRQGESNDAIPVFCLTIDPNNYDIVWAGLQYLGQLYRSADGGQTWEKRVTGIIGGDGLSFRGISVEPGNSNIVYAAGEISSWNWAGKRLPGLGFDLTKGVLYKSTDGGLHWTAIWRGDNLARYIWIDPANVETLYLSTGIFDREAANSNPQSKTPGGEGVLKSTDGGKTWNQINEGLRNLYIGSLFMHPTNPNILLAGAGNNSYLEGSGAYLTTDGGAHWQLVLDTTSIAVTSVEFSTNNPKIAYAGGHDIFAVSMDGGQTWQRREHSNGRWGPLGIIPGFPIDFQVDPRNPQRIFSNNYGGGNFLSEDGGNTWISASTGYTGADLRSLSVHPDYPSITYTNGRSGPFMSLDAGIHWQGINPENLGAIIEGSQISLDPSNPQHVLMTESNRVLIYWSDDGGITWKESTTDMADITPIYGGSFTGGVEALAYAPSLPNRVYAVFGNNGCKGLGTACDDPQPASTVAVSNDGGRSWTHLTSTPHDTMPGTAVIVHPSDADRAWIALPNFGVFKTSDGSATWQSASQGLGSAKVISLAIDASNADILYAGTLAQGVYKSLDGGGTWRWSGSGMDPNEPVFTIAIDPVHTNVVYAGSLRSGVFRSENGGQTWVKINNGLRTRSVHDLAISADGGTLYAGTRGEGVFRLDLNGQPPEPAPSPTSIPTTTPAPTVVPPSGAASPTPEPTGKPGICGSALILPLVMFGLWLFRRRY